MSSAGSRIAVKSMSVCLFAATLAVAAVPAHKTITVTQGTDMEVAVSPNHKEILADVQGIIFSFPFAGGPGHALTTPLQEASHPDWSAKGGFVALQSYAGGTFHIWTMHPDGTGLKPITSGHGDDREPRVSPDGKTIAFSSDRAFEGSYDIWTVDVATGELKRITTSAADEYEPNWSPDGHSLAFVSGTGIISKSVEQIDLASMKQHTLASVNPDKARVNAPSFSPDGKLFSYVLFEGAGLFLDTAHLVVSSVEGGKVKYTGKAGDTFPFPPTWLSDKELLYTADGNVLHTDIDTGTETAIPFSAAIPANRPSYVHKRYDFDSVAPHAVKGIYGPALSPDGKSVAFVALNQLYVMKIGAKPLAITHDMFYKQGPAWAPDGKTLAYVSDKDGVENVYLHDMNAVDSSGDHRAVPSPTAQIMPAWSHDGKLMAFQDQTGATLLADLATGTAKPLAPSTFFPGRAAFSPNGKTVSIATIKPYTKRIREGTVA